MQESSDTTSQFWSDFWATIHHFTHPFSSNYFDQLFETQQANKEGEVPDPSIAANPSAHATDAKYFASVKSFQRYWEGLQSGQVPGQQPQTAFEHLQASWIDVKSMTYDFINALFLLSNMVQLLVKVKKIQIAASEAKKRKKTK
ncbi:hypothetical protein BGZ73_009181 [Actinomortierella ambigua]|nr:hypothetical protein BGZ73_009181 [Actinomortierella ambigua]